RERGTSGYAQIRCCDLATLGGSVISHGLTFVQGCQSGSLHGGHVNEDVLRAVRRLNEPVTLLGVEPLNSSCSHCSVYSLSVDKVSCGCGLARPLTTGFTRAT